MKEENQITEVDVLGRFTYIGRLFHDCGKACLATDILKVGPNGKEIIKMPCQPIKPIHSCSLA